MVDLNRMPDEEGSSDEESEPTPVFSSNGDTSISTPSFRIPDEEGNNKEESEPTPAFSFNGGTSISTSSFSFPSIPPWPPIPFQEEQQPPSSSGIPFVEPLFASINSTPLFFPFEPPIHLLNQPCQPSEPPPPPQFIPPSRAATRLPNYDGSTRIRAPRHRPRNNERITPLFPWATDRHASFHTLDHLTSNGITSISGDTQCRRCEFRGKLSYDLVSEFREVSDFITAKFHKMHDRAPQEWLNPTYSECPQCNQPNSMKPVISERKESINWLFLFLGQTLGCCTLDQLRWFCKHTGNHGTGLKNRVLFLSYMDIWEQLKKPHAC